MKKKIDNEEIDLIEIFIILKKGFWKILSIMFFTAGLTYIYALNEEPVEVKYKATTEIRPISTFDLSEYELYNTYVKADGSGYNKNTKLYKKEAEEIDEEFFLYDQIKIDKSLLKSFEIITKKYLMNLFIDKLNENKIFINTIKKVNLVKKENYADNQDYENAVQALASSIKLIPSKTDSWYLQYRTENINDWQSFLLIVEKEANYEIQNYIKQNFKKLMTNAERIKKYRIEDIEIEIANSLNSKKIAFLKQEKKMISKDKKLERLKNLFIVTPVFNSDDFYAAKIIVNYTKYKNETKKQTDKKSLIFSAMIIGLIIGIFYVIITHSVRNRSKQY